MATYGFDGNSKGRVEVPTKTEHLKAITSISANGRTLTCKNANGSTLQTLTTQDTTYATTANVVSGSGALITSGGVYNKLNSYVVVQKVTSSNITVASDSACTLLASIPAKSGYRAVGIVGYSVAGDGSTFVNLREVCINANGQACMLGRNMRESSVTIHGAWYILYVKN